MHEWTTSGGCPRVVLACNLRFMTASEDKRVVWILGAGFTVPLGGPLFRQLISDKTLKQLRAWPEFCRSRAAVKVPLGINHIDVTKYVDMVSLAPIVCDVYNAGLSKDGNGLWDDAEQFLDVLEIAVSGDDENLASDFESLLRKLRHEDAEAKAAFETKGGLVTLHREAVRFVASACTVFLRKFERNPALVRDSELWDPYRRWAMKLRASDSVLTFNYDRALNLLNDYLVVAQKNKPSNRFVLASPVGCDRDYFDSIRSGIVPMYHLHGHVGWQLSDEGEIDCGDDSTTGVRPDRARAHEDPERAVLGLPGRIKAGMSTGLLKDAWKPAMKAIGDATHVVFVGYRFPETDNIAKQALTTALRENPKAIVHLVLGPANPDLPRLKGMIEWTRDKRENPVQVHEMWCQDFFAVFERGRL